MKLNGWKRIGIIISVAWILGGGAYTYQSGLDSRSKWIVAQHVACDNDSAVYHEDAARERAFNECNQIADEGLAIALKEARISAVIVAFAPVPLGWGFAYLFLSLIRWVRKGFAVSSV